MRKKLDTRFPAARIKKIMQADEDVGKIAMAVPVLVSKALELFLQDLCDRTYDITVQRGAKTVGALHLKKCVHSYNVFDFLKEVVSKVPDYSHSDTAADTSKRRKVVADEFNDGDEESKRSNMKICHTTSGRGRGRGRGRGQGRATRTTEWEPPRHEVESDSMTSIQDRGKQIPSPREAMDNCPELKEASKENVKDSNGTDSELRNFNLNAGVDEVADKTALDAVAAASTSLAVAADVSADGKGEEDPGWSLSEMDKMAVNPLQLAQLNSKLDEDDEDYDEV